jgi:hypothetical protein
MASPFDILILLLTIGLPLAYYFRDSLPIIGGKSNPAAAVTNGHAPKKREEEGDPRDFVGKMERAVSLNLMGSDADDRVNDVRCSLDLKPVRQRNMLFD